jgi:hypothetical protein
MLGQNGSLFAWNLSINLPNLKSVGVKKDCDLSGALEFIGKEVNKRKRLSRPSTNAWPT